MPANEETGMLPGLAGGPVGGIVIIIGLIVLGVVVVRDSQIDPIGWHPPDPPAMEGALEPNTALADGELVVRCDGPEDVGFDADGRLYTGVEDGAIIRTVEPVDPDDTEVPTEPFAESGGRPLGMTFHDDELIVAAQDAGLISVSSSGEVTSLSTRAAGQDISFADDVYVTADGTVYFTDATAHTLYQHELFELRDTGRLLAYDPDSGDTTVELTGLGFANGVCPHDDGESILITETARYRVTRYWYRGDRAGESEQFTDNLVGYPDNIEAPGDGTYWVAIPALRENYFDRLQGRPWLKRQLGKLPESVIESISGDPYGLVLHLDEDGDVIQSLHDPDGNVFGVTSATPRNNALYLGSLFGEQVTRYPLT